MRETFVDSHCAALTGTQRELPFGDDTVVWTVHGHMFAAYTMGGEGLSLRLGDKITAQKMVGQRRATSAPYLRSGGWVMLPWSAGPEELRARMDASYHLVRQDGNATAHH